MKLNKYDQWRKEMKEYHDSSNYVKPKKTYSNDSLKTIIKSYNSAMKNNESKIPKEYADEFIKEFGIVVALNKLMERGIVYERQLNRLENEGKIKNKKIRSIYKKRFEYLLQAVVYIIKTMTEKEFNEYRDLQS